MIGQLGDIEFEVSSDKVLTFDGLSRKSSARYAYHSRQGMKELGEFLGPSLEEISMTISLSVTGNINPNEEIKRLRELLISGEAVLFILNGEVQGDGHWCVTSVSESHKLVDAQGRTLAADVQISLKEYLKTRE